MIFVFAAKRLKAFQELSGHHAPVSFCAFSPDGQSLATSSFDKNVIIWDPVSCPLFLIFFLALMILKWVICLNLQITKEQLLVLSGHDAIVTSVAYSLEGHLASTSYDKKVIIWKTDDSNNGESFIKMPIFIVF